MQAQAKHGACSSCLQRGSSLLSKKKIELDSWFMLWPIFVRRLSPRSQLRMDQVAGSTPVGSKAHWRNCTIALSRRSRPEMRKGRLRGNMEKTSRPPLNGAPSNICSTPSKPSPFKYKILISGVVEFQAVCASEFKYLCLATPTDNELPWDTKLSK